MPTPRAYFAVGAVRNKIAIAGGNSSTTADIVDANEIYDPIADKWRAAAPIPNARSYIAAAVVEDRMYVLGGTNRQDTLPDNEIYDIDGDAWSTGRPMTVGRAGLAAAALGGRIYVIGGARRGEAYGSTNEIYQT